MMRKLFLTLCLALATAGAASAQNFLEYGITAGANVPHYSTNMDGINIGNKLGWQAGVVVRINTPIVAIQPELLFVRNAIDLTEANYDLKVKSNSLSLPLLASVRLLRIIHINVGPVFSLTNDCKYKFEGNKYDFGRMQPTVGYAVGAAVQLQHLLVDLRFNGQFKTAESLNHHNIDVKMKSYSVALSLGYLF